VFAEECQIKFTEISQLNKDILNLYSDYNNVEFNIMNTHKSTPLWILQGIIKQDKAEIMRKIINKQIEIEKINNEYDVCKINNLNTEISTLQQESDDIAMRLKIEARAKEEAKIAKAQDEYYAKKAQEDTIALQKKIAEENKKKKIKERKEKLNKQKKKINKKK
jgi:hypothetical protein